MQTPESRKNCECAQRPEPVPFLHRFSDASSGAEPWGPEVLKGEIWKPASTTRNCHTVTCQTPGLPPASCLLPLPLPNLPSCAIFTPFYISFIQSFYCIADDFQAVMRKSEERPQLSSSFSPHFSGTQVAYSEHFVTMQVILKNTKARKKNRRRVSKSRKNLEKNKKTKKKRTKRFTKRQPGRQVKCYNATRTTYHLI